MSSRKRKFQRRIRARIEKTGESYSVARMHLSKAHLNPQPEEISSPAPQAKPPRFAIHVALAQRSRAASSNTAAAVARREHRAWSRIGQELTRVCSLRGGRKALAVLKGKGLDVEQLERLALSLATLPTNLIRQMEVAAEQYRQMEAIASQMRYLQPIYERLASLPAAVREAADHAAEMLAASTPFRDEARTVFRQASEAARVLVANDQVTVALRELPAWEDALTEAFKGGPVAAARGHINEGPVSAALRHMNEGAAATARRWLHDSGIAV